jgi:hypothetical protein
MAPAVTASATATQISIGLSAGSTDT